MISLITFPNLKCVARKEAERLGLTITKTTRFGLREGIVTPLRYEKDCIKGEDAFYDEEDGHGWLDGVGEIVHSSYLYYPLPDNSPDYVELEEYQLVDLAKFAGICDESFLVVRSIDPEAPEKVAPANDQIVWCRNTGIEPEGDWVAELSSGDR